MFDKIRQGQELLKMRSQAMALKKELEQIRQSEEDKGVKIVVNGAQEVTYIEIDGVEQKDLMNLINRAMKNVQKSAAKKMMEMGGGLSGLLGKM